MPERTATGVERAKAIIGRLRDVNYIAMLRRLEQNDDKALGPDFLKLWSKKDREVARSIENDLISSWEAQFEENFGLDKEAQDYWWDVKRLSKLARRVSPKGRGKLYKLVREQSEKLEEKFEDLPDVMQQRFREMDREETHYFWRSCIPDFHPKVPHGFKLKPKRPNFKGMAQRRALERALGLGAQPDLSPEEAERLKERNSKLRALARGDG